MLTFPRQTLGIGLLCELSAHIAALAGDTAGAAASPGTVSPSAWASLPRTGPSGTGQPRRPACPGGSAASPCSVTPGWPRGWGGDAVRGQGPQQRRAGCQRSRTEDASAGSTSRSAPGLLPRREPPAPGAARTERVWGRGLSPPHSRARHRARAALPSVPVAVLLGPAGEVGQRGGGSPAPPSSAGHPCACPAPQPQPGGLSAFPGLRQLLPQKPTDGGGGGFAGDPRSWRAQEVPGALHRCGFEAAVPGRG